MPRAADKRLARLGWRDCLEEGRRDARIGYRFFAAVCTDIYRTQVAAGIDPEAAPVRRFGEWCMQELEKLGEGPEMQRKDAAITAAKTEEWARQHAGEPDPRDEFIAELDRMGLRYADGSTPDPDAPLIQWYAWARMQPLPPDPDDAASDPAPDCPASPAPQRTFEIASPCKTRTISTQSSDTR
jgi:hypothetical protein